MAAAPSESATPSAASGGLKAWLPLIATLAAMPLLAYATMTFLILPKMKAASGAAAASVHEGSETPAGEDESTGAPGEEAGGLSRKGRISVRMEKMVVNVAGTMGTRFLMASITLVGGKPSFRSTVEDNMDQLMDLATSTLSSKTIADLEKPGARNLIKTELIAVFNNALGGSLVKEIYIPEMAIQ